MSAVPPPIPLEHGTVAARPPPARTALLWLCILLAVAVHAVLQYSGSAEQKAASKHAFATFQLEISGRYAVGMHALLSSAVNAKIPAIEASLEKQVGDDITNRLRVIMIEAELSGAPAAREKLLAMQSTPSLTPDQRQDIDTLLQLYQSGAASLDAASRARLLDRYNWFARLALSHGLPSSDPLRAAAINPAIRAFVGLLGFGFLAFCAFGAGLVLLILAIIFLARRSIRTRYERIAQRDTAFLELFAIYLGTLVLLSATLFIFTRSGGHAPFAVNWLIVITIPLPLLWPWIRGWSWRQTKQNFGLFAPRGILREIGAGLLGYITGLPIMALGALITAALTYSTGISTGNPVALEARNSPWIIVQLFLLASVWAPVTEELMFRGAFFGYLRQRFGWLISAGVVALIFASMHPYAWVAIPMLFSIAMVLAGIREWRGSIVGCMAAHALHNTLLVILFILISG